MMGRFQVSTDRRPTTSNLESLEKGLDEDEEQIEDRHVHVLWPIASGHKTEGGQ